MNLWTAWGTLLSHRHISQSISQFSCSVMSDSLRPHELQHAKPPCPSSTPGVYSNSRPLSRWCHLAISSSVVPFSSCPQSLPASESFPMSQLFAWGGQSIAASASVLPMNTQDWSPLEWTGWNPMNSRKRENDRILKEELPRSVGAQYATEDQWRNNFRKNEGMEPKQKQYPVVDVTGDRSKVRLVIEAKLLSHDWLFATPWATRFLRPWNFLGKSTGVGCHFLL